MIFKKKISDLLIIIVRILQYIIHPYIGILPVLSTNLLYKLRTGYLDFPTNEFLSELSGFNSNRINIKLTSSTKNNRNL